MFNNIKSSYFTKLIFRYLAIEIKLKICKYNKALQNLLNINILHYKILSGRYIIYEANKKGKECNILTDEIIFKGEYSKGKRNGKGKEYNKDGYTIFEGEYLNSKRNGKGKEYNENGIAFEGEYLKGKKWNGKLYDKDNNYSEIINGAGFIKEYNIKGNLIYEGEYKNGQRNGKGKEYIDYNNKLLFEGEFLNNKKWNGKFFYDNNKYTNLINGKGLIKEYFYEGEYLNGEKNGKGKEYDKYEQTIVYDGEFVNGKRNGQGKEYYIFNNIKKLLFDGEYFYNYKSKGKLYFYDRLEFEGEFLFDKKWNGKGYDENGQIIYELKNGKGKVKEYDFYPFYFYLVFEGEYLNGKKNGKGKEYDSNGELIFEGEYKNGKRNGIGKEYYISGLLLFAGEYLNNEKWNGKEYDYQYNSIKYEREYLNGKRLLIEKEYDLDGNLIFEGEYFNGKRWNGKRKEFDKNGKLVFDGELLKGKRWNGKIRKLGQNSQIIFDGEYSNGTIQSQK